jgi:hypothetical protein
MAVAAVPLAMKAVSTVFAAKAVDSVRKKSSSPSAAPPKAEPVMPDIEGVKRARRKSEASRVGTGRASTIFTQPATSGSLGPA